MMCFLPEHQLTSIKCIGDSPQPKRSRPIYNLRRFRPEVSFRIFHAKPDDEPRRAEWIEGVPNQKNADVSEPKLRDR